ncbi:MAG: UDP-N-acetylmuramoyl-tripeptide--D-alanyl-D-alanine ligase [Tannerella sp.]|jgi:UDP-N-acetylmuramoyl-tripeptide--D-alanyl-D-alanine ligase|nr:UDP-N-acetylmuramoyl-tripeptide--D-alanyl-D-alanine ligase [Tannerella sp.]
MNIYQIYELFRRNPTITTDSRKCLTGSMFFALKGDTFDGNVFAADALNGGCACAVIDDARLAGTFPNGDARIILVDDALETLQQLAALHRRSLNPKVIAVTGTNGKTTTKELIAAVLSKKFNVLYTQGNLNNHIGVPLTLLQLTDKHDMAVIEMGANHPGEIRALANIAQPDYGIITNVGRAHLEGFGSFEGVINAKCELYDYLRNASGTVFIDRDNAYLMPKASQISTVMYGETSDGDAKPFVEGKTTSLAPYLNFRWNSLYDVKTNLIGDYNLKNALAAIATGLYFNVAPEEINRAIAEYEPRNNRSQLKETAYNHLIIDAYNANPTSMIAALDNFGSMDVSPKALIMGDMLELGDKSPELHREIVEAIKSKGFSEALFCGKMFSGAAKNFKCFDSVESLNDYLEANPLRGYYILIKGSRGIRLEKTVEKL